MEIGGARILLTGATGGIGHAIARALAARGAQLVVTGRRRELLEPLARELDAQPLVVDLSDADEVRGLLGAAGEIDVLVANAALPGNGRLETFSEEQVDRILDVNLRAPIELTRELLPGMTARGRGHLVYISSVGGKATSPTASLYNATKFGLRGFALAIRAELHGSGVGASLVSPGFIRDAGMFADTGVKLPPGVGTKAPEDVAAAVIDAITEDRAEIDVAPLGLRLGVTIASVAPETSARVARRMGGDKVAHAMSTSDNALTKR